MPSFGGHKLRRSHHEPRCGIPLLPNAITQDTPRWRGEEEMDEMRGEEEKGASAATGAHPPITADDVRTVIGELNTR